MLFPCVAPRIEYWYNTLGVWIDCRQIGALKCVAAVARQCQIFRIVASAVLNWNDMFDVECEQTAGRQPAILAAIAGSLPYQGSNERGHEPVGRRSSCLASAWRIPMRSIASTYSIYSARSDSLREPEADLDASSSIRFLVGASSSRSIRRFADSGVSHLATGASRRINALVVLGATMHK